MLPENELSIIVPITESRYDDVGELFNEYKKAVEDTGLSYQFVYVLDGPYPEVADQLCSLKENGEKITIIKLAKYFGEATALKVGFENSAGKLIMTLPAYQQVDSTEITRIVEKCRTSGVDMVVARRWPRVDSMLNRIQSKVFNKLMVWMTGVLFNDLGCGVRIFQRRVIDEVQLYGDQHRFLPVLANKYGFKIIEEDVKQSQKDAFQRVYPVGVYLRRLLDLLSVFFLIKFTKKPLRFFGLVGVTILSIGALLLLFLIGDKLFGGVPLGDRPALMLSSLFVVLGVQVVAIGLIGEIIIFTHAKELKEYTVEEIIN